MLYPLLSVRQNAHFTVNWSLQFSRDLLSRGLQQFFNGLKEVDNQPSSYTHVDHHFGHLYALVRLHHSSQWIVALFAE